MAFTFRLIIGILYSSLGFFYSFYVALSKKQKQSVCITVIKVGSFNHQSSFQNYPGDIVLWFNGTERGGLIKRGHQFG